MTVEQSEKSGLAALFNACRSENRAALIGYLPTGYPDVPTSIDAMKALTESGCDLIEVGVPYSDPGMDGPTIATASEVALRGGVRVRDTLTAVEAISNAGGHAVVMTYWNPVLRYGVNAFARDLATAGGHGLITPDLIPDEADEWLAASDRHQFDIVVVQQFHDRTALDVVILDDQQSLRARRGELLEPVECGFQAVGGRLLDEIRERTVRQAVLPLLFQSDDLDRNVTRQRIVLELAEHGPAEHVRQENIERDRRWLELLGKIQRFRAACSDQHLEALVARQIDQHTGIMRVIFNDQ